MIYFLQAAFFAAAFFMGTHDAPACDCFTIYGSTPAQQRMFHWTNLASKIAIVVPSAVMVLTMANLGLALIVAGLSVPIMWPTFNITLNLERKVDRPWYYVSMNSNRTDQWLYRKLGTYAGAWLALFSLILIITLNLIAYFVYGKSCPGCFWMV